jgi:ferredoxin
MSFKVLFEPGKCQGYANCLIEAPEIWDFDDSNDRAVLKVRSVDCRPRSLASEIAHGAFAQHFAGLA